jgi:hypothetical protein
MQIDVVALINFLSPALPLLLGVGEKTADGFIHKMGSDGWDLAKKVLALLRPQIDSDPEAQEAVQLFIDEPNGKASRVLLRNKFAEILENNKKLAKKIFYLIESDSDSFTNIKVDKIRSSGNKKTMKVRGNNNIVIGQGKDINIQNKDNFNSSKKEA